MKELSQSDWQAGIAADADVIIIDVRTPEEWEEGIIPGARTLNIFDAHGFMDGISDLDKSKACYVYCRSGGRSGQACQILSSQGFSNVNNLIGGMSEWKGEVTDFKG